MGSDGKMDVHLDVSTAGYAGRLEVLEGATGRRVRSEADKARIEELETNRFLTGSLLGKLIVFDDDVKAGTKLPDGALKKLSEEKSMTGERKFGPPFAFKCVVVPVLLCNSPLSLSDLTHGMLRRLMFIPFDKKFEERTIDRTLFDQIWGEELPGILNKALAGLERVMQRGIEFKEPASVVNAKKSWIGQSNPIPEFIRDRCSLDPTYTCYLQDLYQDYVAWASLNGYTLKQQRNTFERNLSGLGYQKANKGKRGTRVMGLKLKATGIV